MSADQTKRVLLVDDEKFLLGIYKVYFEKAGYEVAVSSDVDDALQILRSGFMPAIILFDITMPDSRSGYEFIDTINRESLGKKSLKIALTNEGQDGAVERMLQLGANGHLLKASYLPAELVAKVEEILQDHNKA